MEAQFERPVEPRAMARWIFENLKPKVTDEYESRTKRLPAMILANGLGPTLAFIRGKEEEGWRLIRQHLEKWMRAAFNLPEDTDVLEWLLGLEVNYYRWVTRKTLEFAEWLQRLASAMTSS